MKGYGVEGFTSQNMYRVDEFDASGAYINRMRDYCAGCAYDVKDRLGDHACPFNALYWDFLIRHEAPLKRNRRLAMHYRGLAAMSDAERAAIERKAEATRHGFGARRRG